MTFDLGRCIVSALTWEISGYYFNSTPMTIDEYEKRYGKDDGRDVMKHDHFLSCTCESYVTLSLHTLDKKISVSYYDDNAEELFRNVRAALASKSDCVNLSKLPFFDSSSSYSFDTINSGHVTTYNG